MRRPLRFAQILTATVALGLSLAACGDKDASGPAGAGEASSAPAAATLTQANFSERVFGALEKAGSAKVHFETGTGAAKLGGNGEIKYGDELALRMKVDSAQQSGPAPQEMVLIGRTMYIDMGGKFMTMSLDAFKGMGVPDLSANLDPKVQAKAFKAAVTKFEQSGKAEELDGVKATPYEVTIDPTKASDVFGTVSTEPITVTYFIGPDDLLRKMVYKDHNGDFVATYTDWGTPVTIEAPAASEIMPGVG
jgi:hypothetical protein